MIREAIGVLRHTMEGSETFMRKTEPKRPTFTVFRERTSLSGEQLDICGHKDIHVVLLAIGSR